MPGTDFGLILLFLMGFYSNLLDPFNGREIVFLFFPIHFHYVAFFLGENTSGALNFVER
jgi:hypothetical protein